MAQCFPKDARLHLPESERTTSLSSSGSLLSISSSSSSPSLPSGFQPSSAHSCSSLASVALDRPTLCRLWNASQSLSVRFCERERWVRPWTRRPARWSVTGTHLQPGPPRLLSAVGRFSVAAVNILTRTAALLLSGRHVQPGAALLMQQNNPVTLGGTRWRSCQVRRYLSGAALS